MLFVGLFAALAMFAGIGATSGAVATSFAATGEETSLTAAECDAKAEDTGGRAYPSSKGGCNFFATIKGPISFDAGPGEVASGIAADIVSQGVGEARGSRGSVIFKPGTCSQKVWESSSTDGNTSAGGVDRAKSPCD